MQSAGLRYSPQALSAESPPLDVPSSGAPVLRTRWSKMSAVPLLGRPVTYVDHYGNVNTIYAHRTPPSKTQRYTMASSSSEEDVVSSHYGGGSASAQGKNINSIRAVLGSTLEESKKHEDVNSIRVTFGSTLEESEEHWKRAAIQAEAWYIKVKAEGAQETLGALRAQASDDHAPIQELEMDVQDRAKEAFRVPRAASRVPRTACRVHRVRVRVRVCVCACVRVSVRWKMWEIGGHISHPLHTSLPQLSTPSPHTPPPRHHGRGLSCRRFREHGRATAETMNSK